jgi:hypothetical protein
MMHPFARASKVLRAVMIGTSEGFAVCFPEAVWHQKGVLKLGSETRRAVELNSTHQRRIDLLCEGPAERLN